MTLRLILSDIGPILNNFWRQEPRMSEITQHGNEAENKSPTKPHCLEHFATNDHQHEPLSHFLHLQIYLMLSRDYLLDINRGPCGKHYISHFR